MTAKWHELPVELKYICVFADSKVYMRKGMKYRWESLEHTIKKAKLSHFTCQFAFLLCPIKPKKEVKKNEKQFYRLQRTPFFFLLFQIDVAAFLYTHTQIFYSV